MLSSLKNLVKPTQPGAEYELFVVLTHAEWNQFWKCWGKPLLPSGTNGTSCELRRRYSRELSFIFFFFHPLYLLFILAVNYLRNQPQLCPTMRFEEAGAVQCILWGTWHEGLQQFMDTEKSQGGASHACCSAIGTNTLSSCLFHNKILLSIIPESICSL